KNSKTFLQSSHLCTSNPTHTHLQPPPLHHPFPQTQPTTTPHHPYPQTQPHPALITTQHDSGLIFPPKSPNQNLPKMKNTTASGGGKIWFSGVELSRSWGRARLFGGQSCMGQFWIFKLYAHRLIVSRCGWTWQPIASND
ncbi:unnamed protein product, partial [Prunus brigantina]